MLKSLEIQLILKANIKDHKLGKTKWCSSAINKEVSFV